MPLWRTTIQSQDSNRPLGFSPQKTAAQVGDAIFWVNEDADDIEHQPYPTSPTAGQQNTWCQNPLIGPEPSSQVNLDTAGTIEYRCWFHHEETATIVVANPIQIGRQATGEVAFVPSPATINATESVSWSNSDEEAHWPAPVGGADDAWLKQPVPSGEVSAAVPFETKGTVQYRCAIAGHTETGSITVA